MYDLPLNRFHMQIICTVNIKYIYIIFENMHKREKCKYYFLNQIIFI